MPTAAASHKPITPATSQNRSHFFSGVFLVNFAIVSLVYRFNREDYFMYIGAFGRAVPFIIGTILLLVA
jgi:hypothetical protein